jgi:hypothetical protein
MNHRLASTGREASAGGEGERPTQRLRGIPRPRGIGRQKPYARNLSAAAALLVGSTRAGAGMDAEAQPFAEAPCAQSHAVGLTKVPRTRRHGCGLRARPAGCLCESSVRWAQRGR